MELCEGTLGPSQSRLPNEPVNKHLDLKELAKARIWRIAARKRESRFVRYSGGLGMSETDYCRLNACKAWKSERFPIGELGVGPMAQLLRWKSLGVVREIGPGLKGGAFLKRGWVKLSLRERRVFLIFFFLFEKFEGKVKVLSMKFYLVR